MRDLIGWLVGGKSSSSNRNQILNLKVVSRRLARSQRKLENQEKKNERKIRAAIQKGDTESARMYANETVRNRKASRGYQSLVNKIDGLVFKLERAEAVQSIVGEMKGLAASLANINNQLNLPEIDNLVGNMQETLESIDDTSELIEDSMDEMFESDIDEGEVDSLLTEYGVEVGISMDAGLPIPTNKSTELEKEIEALRSEEA